MFEVNVETSAILIAALLVIRVVIVFRYQINAVDEYSYLLLLREFRKKIPIDLGDKFTLEDSKSFYPIGYLIYLYIFRRLLNSKLGKAAIIILPDFLEFIVAAIFLKFISVEFDYFIIFFLIVFSPSKLSYNNQLSSRGLGDLFFFLFCMAIVSVVEFGQGSLFLYFLISASVAGVILTHKMTLQLLVLAIFPALLIFSDINLSFLLGSLIAAIVGSCLLLGKDFSVGQARAHLDIVSFWHRNWRYLGEDQFYLFRDQAVQSETRFHANKFGRFIEKMIRSIGHNPMAAVIVPYVIFSGDWNVVVTIIMAIWVMVLATLFINPLKCLGAGHLYVQNTVGVSMVFWILELQTFSDGPNWLFIFALIGFLGASGLFVFQLFKSNHEILKTRALEESAEFLNSLEAGTVLAIPFGSSNFLGLRTKHKIFFGGHTLGFKKLEPYWPVWRKSPTADKNFSIDYIVSQRSEEDLIKVLFQDFNLAIVNQNDFWIIRRAERSFA